VSVRHDPASARRERGGGGRPLRRLPRPPRGRARTGGAGQAACARSARLAPPGELLRRQRILAGRPASSPNWAASSPSGCCPSCPTTARCARRCGRSSTVATTGPGCRPCRRSWRSASGRIVGADSAALAPLLNPVLEQMLEALLVVAYRVGGIGVEEEFGPPRRRLRRLRAALPRPDGGGAALCRCLPRRWTTPRAPSRTKPSCW